MTTITKTAQKATAVAANSATQKATRVRFSAEWWSYWAGVLAVIATAVAALAGVASWYFSQIVSAEQERRNAEQQERAETAERERAKFEEESRLAIAKANERAAEANENAAALNDRAAKSDLQLAELRAGQEPRKVRFLRARTRVIDALKGDPKVPVTVWYQPDDVEAYELAKEISGALGAAGWTAETPKPIPVGGVLMDVAGTGVFDDLPSAERTGGTASGVSILSAPIWYPGFPSTLTPPATIPYLPAVTRLTDALKEALGSAEKFRGLPTGVRTGIALIVGPKP